MKSVSPNIVDVTVKEGGFRVNHCFLPEQVADIAREVERSGLSVMEVSHGCGIGSFKRGFPGLHSDKVYLKAAREGGRKLDFSVYISGSEGSEQEIDPLTDLFQIGRVGISVHEPRKIESHLKKLKELNKTAVGVLQRIAYRSPQETAESAKILQDQGADVVCVVDTFGSLEPDEVTQYVESILKKLEIPLGFQGRNHSGRAVENSLSAYRAGAQWLDASLSGMGRGGGVTPMEALVHLLQNEGLCQDLDILEMTRASKNYVIPAIRSFPVPSYVDLLLSKHRIDFYPEFVLERIADILNVPLEKFLLELKKSDPDFVQLKDEHLRDFLAKEHLDLDVVLEYIKTGKVPKQ
jgi:4-hydroxy 2-oxovalerate aldolase